MKKCTVAVFVLLIAVTGAFAQEAPAKPAGFTVDDKAARELETWLVDQPFKFSAPVLKWIEEQRRRTESAPKATLPKVD